MDYGLKPLGKERFWLLLLLAPTLIGLILGAFGSILATIVLSFMRWDLLSKPVWAGLENYTALITNEKFSIALTNTIKFSAMYVPGVVIISMFVAILLNRKIRGITLFRTIYFLPCVTSAVATSGI
jgi:multiple sugar transport system permease protein